MNFQKAVGRDAFVLAAAERKQNAALVEDNRIVKLLSGSSKVNGDETPSSALRRHGCGSARFGGAAHAEANQVRFARQLGLGYLQFYVMQEKQLVEAQRSALASAG